MPCKDLDQTFVTWATHSCHPAMPPIYVDDDDDRDAIEFSEPDPGSTGFHSISHDAVPRPSGDSFAFNPPIQRKLAQPVEPVLETPPCKGSMGVFSPVEMEAGWVYLHQNSNFYIQKQLFSKNILVEGWSCSSFSYV